MCKDKEVEECWNNFWEDIIVKDGNLDLDQIKKELYDYHLLLENTRKLYFELTNGAISKPLTEPSVIINLVEE